MPKLIGIYQIVSPSNKVYVGQSWDIEHRKYIYSLGHCSAQRHLFNSLKKYGFNAHRFEVLESLSETVTQQALDEREQFYMDLRLSEGIKLLNLRGGGSTGKLSMETRLRLRLANLGKKASAETRQKQSRWQMGLKRPHIIESNKRRAESGALYFQTRIAPSGSDHPRFGKRHSAESLAKMSRSQRGHSRATPDVRAIMSQKTRGEANAAAILTEAQVREIRSKYQPYVYQQKQLAEEYGVSRAAISGIVDGRLWKHLLRRNHEWEAVA